MVLGSIFSAIKDKVLEGSSEEDIHENSAYLISLGVLLWIVAEADNKFLPQEKDQIKQTLKDYGEITDADFPIVERAIEEANTMRIDVHSFTKDIKKEMERPQKLSILDSLFRVACIDKDLNLAEHEEIRKIADLIGLDHSEFIESKIKIKKEFGLDTLDL